MPSQMRKTLEYFNEGKWREAIYLEGNAKGWLKWYTTVFINGEAIFGPSL